MRVALAVFFACSMLMLAGCTRSFEPWTVTGLQAVAAESNQLVITYLDPTGREARWVASQTGRFGELPTAVLECFNSARVGKALPECARSSAINLLATPSPTPAR